jgi:hypothetical protein
LTVIVVRGKHVAFDQNGYGVLMFLVRTDKRDFGCFLYKHKPLWPQDERIEQ